MLQEKINGNKNKWKQNRSGGEKVVFGIMFVVFLVYSLSVILSLVWAFFQSLKTNLEFWDNMRSFPKEWKFSNYAKAFTEISYSGYTFLGMFFNSIWYAVGSSLLSVFSHCVTGYIFAKYQFKGKRIAFSIVLFTITLPIVGSLPSMYQICIGLHITDSPLFLVTSLGGFSSNFLITYGFFKGIDNSYAESARVDGAGRFCIFFRIMLPFAKGTFFALTLLSFIGQWNNYETPILFLDKMPVLASGLYRYKIKTIYESDEPVYLAAVLLVVVPVLAVVIAFGDKIMGNVMVGGIKG